MKSLHSCGLRSAAVNAKSICNNFHRNKSVFPWLSTVTGDCCSYVIVYTVRPRENAPGQNAILETRIFTITNVGLLTLNKIISEERYNIVLTKGMYIPINIYIYMYVYTFVILWTVCDEKTSFLSLSPNFRRNQHRILVYTFSRSGSWMTTA